MIETAKKLRSINSTTINAARKAAAAFCNPKFTHLFSISISSYTLPYYTSLSANFCQKAVRR